MRSIMKRLVFLERRQAAPAKNPLQVLWSGSLMMTDTDVIMLPQLVSAQQNGVILVWSRYDTAGSADANDTWEYQYVPRWHVDGSPTGTSFGTGKVLSANASSFIYKYVYVKDDRVQGNLANATPPSDTRHLRAILAW